MGGVGSGPIRIGDGFGCDIPDAAQCLPKEPARTWGRKDEGVGMREDVTWTPTSRWLSLLFSPSDPGEDHDSKTLLREPV